MRRWERAALIPALIVAAGVTYGLLAFLWTVDACGRLFDGGGR